MSPQQILDLYTDVLKRQRDLLMQDFENLPHLYTGIDKNSFFHGVSQLCGDSIMLLRKELDKTDSN